MLAVVGALFANALIAVLKLAAAFVTGSSGMMAEALHSVADTTNQIFLLLGLRFYQRPASKKHPFGYGRERFFWSFIAAIFIFGVGSTYAVYEGVVKLKHPHAPENLFWAYLVLGLSFLLESASISLAIYQELKEARAEGFSFFQYLRESKDPTAKTVLFEDSASPQSRGRASRRARFGFILGRTRFNSDRRRARNCSFCIGPHISRFAVRRSSQRENCSKD